MKKYINALELFLDKLNFLYYFEYFCHIMILVFCILFFLKIAHYTQDFKWPFFPHIHTISWPMFFGKIYNPLYMSVMDVNFGKIYNPLVMDVNNVAYIFYANHSTTIVMIVMAV